MKLRSAGVFQMESHWHLSATGPGCEGQLQRQGIRCSDLGKQQDWFTSERADGNQFSLGHLECPLSCAQAEEDSDRCTDEVWSKTPIGSF